VRWWFRDVSVPSTNAAIFLVSGEGRGLYFNILTKKGNNVKLIEDLETRRGKIGCDVAPMFIQFLFDVLWSYFSPNCHFPF